MRRTRLAASVLGSLVALGTAAAHADDDRRGGAGRPTREITIKIVGFNDYHGNLQSPGTFGAQHDDPAARASTRRRRRVHGGARRAS